MFTAISKSLRAMHVPAIPLFRTSKLPAIPKDKIPLATQELHLKNWQALHADKFCGIPMGIALENDADICLMAITVSNEQGDLKMALSRNLPQGYWSLNTIQETVFVLKCRLDDLVLPYSVFVADANYPAISVLGEGTTLTLNNHTQLPTSSVFETLPLLESSKLEDLLNDTFQGREVSQEPYRLESQAQLHTLSQLDVKMRSYLTHFCYELLLNSDKNSSLLPLLQEIEALFDSFSQNFGEIPPSHEKETYFQAFYALIYQVRVTHCLRLPPRWSDGIGAQLREKYAVPFLKTDTQLDYAQLQEHVFELMSEAIGDEAKMLGACQSAMEEIARSFTVTKIEADQLKRYISRQSGMKLNMSKMDTQINNLRLQYRGVVNLPNLVTNVTNFLNHQTEYRFDSAVDANRLMRWEGTHWEPMEDYEISNIINTYFASNLTAKGTRNLQTLLSAVKNKLALPLRRVSSTGVNFNNGFVNPHLQVIPHDPDMGLTYTLPFTFNPEQIYPPEKLEAFLNQIWPKDPDNILALQEAMAATFFNTGTLFQRAILLHGMPKSGKSQILDIMRGLIPQQKRVSLPPNKWGDNDSLAALSNKLINLCGELSESDPINSQRFKDVVDGTEVTLKKSIHQHIALHPMATHWFASNHLPKTKDFSEGFTRRWLILDIEQPIAPEDRVLDIGNQIVVEEKDKIISWALQAYPRLLNNRDYTLPGSHHELTRQLGQMNNNVRFFFEASGYIELAEDSMVAVLKSLPRDELVEELREIDYVAGRDLYTLYCASVREFKNGATVDEGEFYRRTKELSGLYQFLQVVGRDSKNRLLIRYYGLEINLLKEKTN